jgi:hypothetical protein
VGVCGCGGLVGEVVIEVTIPIRIESVANLREHHMARARRARAHRQAVHWALRAEAILKGTTGPLTITLTRIAPRSLDLDNAIGGMKAARDGIADFLGRDDGDPLLTWKYGQDKAKGTYALRVRIEA